jgi:hypothetical protein
MKLATIAMAACCLSTGAIPAFADQPLLRPARDVDVTYRAPAGAQQPKARVLEQRVRWLVAAHLMRIDPPTPGMFVILDYVARRMNVVREANRSVIEMTAPEEVAGVAGAAGTGSYLRRGTDTVAGLPCTDWETRDRDGREVVVCMTNDGVLLRARSDGGILVSASAVHYAPQDPGVFQVPPGYTHRSAERAR